MKKKCKLFPSDQKDESRDMLGFADCIKWEVNRATYYRFKKKFFPPLQNNIRHQEFKGTDFNGVLQLNHFLYAGAMFVRSRLVKETHQDIVFQIQIGSGPVSVTHLKCWL